MLGSYPKGVNSRNPLWMMKMVSLEGKEPAAQQRAFFIPRPASAGIPEGRHRVLSSSIGPPRRAFPKGA